MHVYHARKPENLSFDDMAVRWSWFREALARGVAAFGAVRGSAWAASHYHEQFGDVDVPQEYAHGRMALAILSPRHTDPTIASGLQVAVAVDLAIEEALGGAGPVTGHEERLASAFSMSTAEAAARLSQRLRLGDELAVTGLDMSRLCAMATRMLDGPLADQPQEVAIAERFAEAAGALADIAAQGRPAPAVIAAKHLPALPDPSAGPVHQAANDVHGATDPEQAVPAAPPARRRVAQLPGPLSLKR